MTNRIVARIIALVLILSSQAHCQILKMEQPKLLKTLKATQAGGQTDVNLSIIPATVTLAGGRQEQGWFAVVTDPRQKLYWWRFQVGTYIEGNSFPADEFTRSCLVYVQAQKLSVFCSTSRHLLVGSSTKAYSAETAIPDLVRSEFNQRAPALDTGFDFFDKAINLWPILGSDFFFEPGRANSIDRVGLRAVSRSDDKWEIIVTGAGQASSRLTFSPDFTLLSSVRLP